MKDAWQWILNLFQKRTIIVFATIFGFLSLFILCHGNSVTVFNKNIDFAEFVKNPFHPLYLSGLAAVSIIFTVFILCIWDSVAWAIQEIKKQWDVLQENNKLKKELNKLPIDEKEILLRAVIQSEKNCEFIYSNKKIKALEKKGLICKDYYPLYGDSCLFTIRDYVFDELQKQLANHIEKELNNLDNFEKDCLLAHYETGHRFWKELEKEIKSNLVSKRLLLIEKKDIFQIPQMVWDRLHLLQENPQPPERGP